MLDPLYDAVGYVLAFFYALIPNLGVAIILLTITVMLLLFPLTAKSARSMLEMQRLQPEIKKLQAKHKGDRQKLNEEMMKLYQEHKVNPLGGCLPILVQLPVFFALFHVLRHIVSSTPAGSSLHTDMLAAERAGHGLEFLGMDLSLQATDNHGSLWAALPYYVLVGLVFLTGYLQSRQSARNQPPGANPQMQMITRVLPLVLGVSSLFFPAGLVLYFFVSNLWRVGQQELIMRKIAPRDQLKKPGRAIDAKSSPGKNRATEEAPAEEEEKAEEKPAERKPPERKPAERKRTPAKAARPAEERPGPLGALRGLFQPPPPPEDADGPSPSPPPKQAAPKQAASRSGSSRAGQSRRRRRRSSNKKRKR
jgi:YidC/Oxa1 family membrane protein insertase